VTQDAVTIGSRLPVSGKPIERPAGGASNYQAANEEAVDLEWVPTRGIGEARFEPDRFRPAACKNDHHLRQRSLAGVERHERQFLRRASPLG